MSIKKTGAKAILYKTEIGSLVSTGTLDIGDTWTAGWYKIGAFATASSTIPALKVTSLFKTPKESGDAITLSAGDTVYPLTLTEVCKVDLELSMEKGAIDATDSCDYPYTVNLPDGFSNLSGSINTMTRFDEDTKEITDMTSEFINKFLDIVEDDGEGTYVLTSANDDDMILMILLNSEEKDDEGMVENWLIIPAMISSASMNIAMKDVLKTDLSYSKGQGQASLYKRTVPLAS